MQLKIEALWDWFEQSESKIRACIIDDDQTHQEYIVHNLNELILDLGMFTWEIGQDEDSTLFMIISPNGDPEGLRIARQVVSRSPTLPNWNFHPARPSKEWNRQITVYNEVMDLLELDVSNWSYLLEKTRQGKFSITFLAADELDDEAAERASSQVLVNEVGEEFRIRKFESVSYRFDDQHEVTEKSLDHLKEELQKMLKA